LACFTGSVCLSLMASTTTMMAWVQEHDQQRSDNGEEQQQWSLDQQFRIPDGCQISM
jgi:hypothetical protein